MTHEDYLFNVRQVRSTLLEIAETYPLLPGLCYTSAFDFVAQHGREYLPTPWKTQPYQRGVQKQCYGNAISLAGQNDLLRYVEGFALAPSGELIPHGWNATGGGVLIDSTWCNTGLVYYGVEFSVERADDATWNGDAHVLNDENRNYPIFQQRWQGEDYSRVWPHSDRLDALRGRTNGKPESVTAWLHAKGETW
jgi:hypothetical protein